MNEEIIATRDSLDYWVSEANEVINMMDGDKISVSLNIAAYIRQFYVMGKRDGAWEYNNNPR